MVMVSLNGVRSATKRLASGKRVTYYYAWTGGPRLRGAPGSPEFVASYHEAQKERKRLPEGSLAALVALYLDSPEWRARAASTQREWRRWLDRIRDDLGDMPVEALDDPKVKRHFRKWRNKWSDAPRAADYAVQVLSRLLSWSIGAGEIEQNHALGIGHLYEGGDRAEIIWDEDERSRYAMSAPSFETAVIVDAACLTGLRRDDLATLKWTEVGELYISKVTGKGQGKRAAVIPIVPELAELLAAIRARNPKSEFVLTNTFGDAWTPSGLSHAVTAFRGKRLHDCRGTLATVLRKAGFKASQIADVMGWGEARVERLLNVYVDREAVVKDMAARLARSE